MLKKISDFFQTLTNVETDQQNQCSLEIATAVLLFEVVRADDNFTEEENHKMHNILTSTFALSNKDVDEIVNQAKLESDHATDYYRYTRLINDNYGIKDKIQIIELLWQTAYADGHLDTIEEHVIRRIAELLHIRHNEFIHAKMRVQAQL